MRVGEIGDHREIVLDHQHGAVGGDALDQRADALDVLVPHAGGRLVEQQHFRIERQRGGDLERALAAIGQLDRHPVGERGQADIGDQRHRPLVEAVERRGRAPEIERAAAAALQARCARFPARSDAGTRRRSGTSAPGRAGRRRPAACAVMSWPLKMMRPRVGLRNLVSRLKQVVLPAPFGPIKAWMVPRLTRRLTPLTATKPANSLVRSSVSRIISSLITQRPLAFYSRHLFTGRQVLLTACCSIAIGGWK